MEDLLEKSKKAAEEAEVFSVYSRKTEAIFEANRLKQVQTKESTGTALRLINGGRIGFAATTRSDYDTDLLNMALEVAPFGAEARFEFPGVQDYPEVQLLDPETERTSEEAMVRAGESAIDRIRATEPEIVCEGMVTRSVSRIRIINSRGGQAEYRKTVFSIMIEGVLVRGTDMLFVGDHEASCHPLTESDFVSRSTIRQLERARETAPAPAGNLPVIFTPHGVASALITPLAVAFNGKTVLRGASPLGHKQGESVLSSNISIRDDSTLDFCPACYVCDDEGVPGQSTPLIQNGVIADFLYDLQTAGEAGTESTGNASRSLASLPGPSASAIIVEEGSTGFEEMVRDIKRGLIVEQVMGATQGNILGGDFSGNVLLGYMVENGNITGRVKNTMISGNVYELLKDGVVIGNDTRWIGGSLKTASVYCPSVAVAGG
ncbi:MAG: TldD/PmbA family protein [Dehalococcoidia bacterium]